MWTKLDDGFYDHPKILQVSLDAVGLYALALSYCGRHYTGGAIPRNCPFIQGRTRLVKELVQARLWDVTKTGWEIHHWSECNPTAEEARLYRERMKDVRSLGGKARAAGASRVAGRFAPAAPNSPAGTSNAAGDAHQPRTRPVPSTIEKDKNFYSAHAPLRTNGQGPTPTPEQRVLLQKWLQELRSAPRSQRDRLTVATIGDLVREFGWTEDQARVALTAVAEGMQ